MSFDVAYSLGMAVFVVLFAAGAHESGRRHRLQLAARCRLEAEMYRREGFERIARDAERSAERWEAEAAEVWRLPWRRGSRQEEKADERG